MRFRLALLASAIAVASSVAAQPAKPRLGVTNIEADEQFASIARQATVALTAALVNSRMLEVLDQSTMLQEFTVGIARAHLNRDRIIQSLRGEACTETQCLAEMGDALEARFMVAGQLSRSGRTLTVAVRLVDVYSTSIVAYPTRTFAADQEGTLAVPMNEIAAEIIHALPGELRLYGLPADATVLVDEKPVVWRRDRPLALTVGRHVVRATRRGFFAGKETVDIEFGTTADVDLGLRRKSALAAVGRSLVFPGRGQYYASRPVRGTLFLLAEIAAIGGIGYMAYTNLVANDDYDDAKATYLDLAGPTVTRQQLDDARKRMTDAWDKTGTTKNYGLIAVGAFAGLHVLNVIDAGAGFPDLSRVRMVERPNGTSLIEVRIELAGRDRR